MWRPITASLGLSLKERLVPSVRLFILLRTVYPHISRIAQSFRFSQWVSPWTRLCQLSDFTGPVLDFRIAIRYVPVAQIPYLTVHPQNPGLIARTLIRIEI